MYPQQQQQHLVPFTSLQQQQPYYSSNPFLWPSESHIHPPGTDPVVNSNVYLPTSTLSAVPASSYGALQSTDSQNWIVNQAEFLRYDVVSPRHLIKVFNFGNNVIWFLRYANLGDFWLYIYELFFFLIFFIWSYLIFSLHYMILWVHPFHRSSQLWEHCHLVLVLCHLGCFLAIYEHFFFWNSFSFDLIFFFFLAFIVTIWRIFK